MSWSACYVECEQQRWVGTLPVILVCQNYVIKAASGTLIFWYYQVPGILTVLDHLGMEIPLGVVGLASEFAPKICSGH